MNNRTDLGKNTIARFTPNGQKLEKKTPQITEFGTALAQLGMDLSGFKGTKTR
ncbi:hypothetical protein ACE1B6_16120 [Aerosakkonemataceae cyanobacterium BLCC-F154]|uniref:Uncharacterized protein n=1 Tax=Floridaenema fluviatile BLCC-F154 TaxID=3153640 RepID=A0ABV4YF94_9CYAN